MKRCRIILGWTIALVALGRLDILSSPLLVRWQWTGSLLYDGFYLFSMVLGAAYIYSAFRRRYYAIWGRVVAAFGTAFLAGSAYNVWPAEVSTLLLGGMAIVSAYEALAEKLD